MFGLIVGVVLTAPPCPMPGLKPPPPPARRNAPPLAKPPAIEEIPAEISPPTKPEAAPAIVDRIGPTPGMKERKGAAMPRIFEKSDRFLLTCWPPLGANPEI